MLQFLRCLRRYLAPPVALILTGAGCLSLINLLDDLNAWKTFFVRHGISMPTLTFSKSTALLASGILLLVFSEPGLWVIQNLLGRYTGKTLKGYRDLLWEIHYEKGSASWVHPGPYCPKHRLQMVKLPRSRFELISLKCPHPPSCTIDLQIGEAQLKTLTDAVKSFHANA